MRFLSPSCSLPCLVPSLAREARACPPACPLVVDMKKVELGSWAEYAMTMGSISLSSRWALVARDAKSNTLEMRPRAGRSPSRSCCAWCWPRIRPATARPPKAHGDAVRRRRAHVASPDTPVQKFQHPESQEPGRQGRAQGRGRNLQDQSHYRDKNAMGTVDVWVNETVSPLGLVKVHHHARGRQGRSGRHADSGRDHGTVSDGYGRQGRHHQEAQALRPEEDGRPRGRHAATSSRLRRCRNRSWTTHGCNYAAGVTKNFPFRCYLGSSLRYYPGRSHEHERCRRSRPTSACPCLSFAPSGCCGSYLGSRCSR